MPHVLISTKTFGNFSLLLLKQSRTVVVQILFWLLICVVLYGKQVVLRQVPTYYSTASSCSRTCSENASKWVYKPILLLPNLCVCWYLRAGRFPVFVSTRKYVVVDFFFGSSLKIVRTFAIWNCRKLIKIHQSRSSKRCQGRWREHSKSGCGHNPDFTARTATLRARRDPANGWNSSLDSRTRLVHFYSTIVINVIAEFSFLSWTAFSGRSQCQGYQK